MTAALSLCIILALIVSGVLYAASKAAPLDPRLIVEAIRQVENTPRGWVGRVGERSEWQFRYETWTQYSAKPFHWASSSRVECVKEQHRVAMAHAEWILRSLPDLNLSANAYSVGLVWTAGYGNVQNGDITPAKYAYAERVEAVYHELVKKTYGAPEKISP